MRLIGVLGGMGPEATILLMERVLAARAAADDADHIPLLVFQYPQVPSRIAALIERRGDDPGPVLADLARRLRAAGAEAIAMPCNTAHAYADAIRSATDLPFLDMIAATVRTMSGRTRPGSRIGMLASPGLRRARVLDAALEAAGLVPVWHADEGTMLTIIRAVKSAGAGPEERAALARIADELAKQAGCDDLLVACTELSLLTGDLSFGLQWTDSLDCLVEEIVTFSLN